jgi:hypothetical protein
VNTRKAPHARPYEGITSRGSTFRHPVFGHDVWVEQETRPFLFPAVEAKKDAAVDLVKQAVREAQASI